MPPAKKIAETNGKNHCVDSRLQAALYLQKLEDGRMFVRYAERAFYEAMEIAPDKDANMEASILRSMSVQLRKRSQEFRIRGNARFNPRRTGRIRRVIIDD